MIFQLGKKVNLECIENTTWSTEIGNYNCKDYERSSWCENGGIGYKWNSSWTWKVNSNGQSARDVCCVCGGTGIPSKFQNLFPRKLKAIS